MRLSCSGGSHEAEGKTASEMQRFPSSQPGEGVWIEGPYLEELPSLRSPGSGDSMHLSSVLSLDGVPCLEKWFGQFTDRMWKQNIKWQHLPPILAFHIRRVCAEIILFSAPLPSIGSPARAGLVLGAGMTARAVAPGTVSHPGASFARTSRRRGWEVPKEMVPVCAFLFLSL